MERFGDIETVVEDLTDLVSDRHVCVIPLGQSQYSRCRLDTFRDHLHFVDYLFEVTTLAEAITDAEVPALAAGAGCDEVADTCKACERSRLPAHGDSETGHFDESSRHKRCQSVVTEALPRSHTCSDRHHVLDCTCRLRANHIGIRIHTEPGS